MRFIPTREDVDGLDRAWKRGAAAVLTDGGLRDGRVLARLPFPTCASEATITTRAAAEPLSGNYPPGEELKAEYEASPAAADADGPAETGANPS